MTTRKRALSGGWYPVSANECLREIRAFLSGFSAPEGHWTGGIAPHAGWTFSGRAAARVINAIADSLQPDRVVIYGGHLSEGSDPIIYTEESWETPMGPLTLDTQTSKDLVREGLAVAAPGNYSDNTVEVQLPLVKHFFPDSSVIAVHSPSSDGSIQLGSALEALLRSKGLTAAYLGSADLTHYGPNYGFTSHGTGVPAVKWVKDDNDRSLIDHALAMDAVGLLRDSRLRHNTCSAGPIASVIAAQSLRGVKHGLLVDYYTSYDVMPSSSFVGYAGIVY
jgi:hypothetical protein